MSRGRAETTYLDVVGVHDRERVSKQPFKREPELLDMRVVRIRDAPKFDHHHWSYNGDDDKIQFPRDSHEAAASSKDALKATSALQ
ncbi:hypothetical protein NMY22_g15822 [Coprinellus aureogranulatus]|nr:hypothetical protein NMY22_g15822 [Coprinellus aureogranulatus]